MFSIFDKWDPNTGVATSIKTIDWRYKTYSNDPQKIYNKGKGYVDSILNWQQGTSTAHSADNSMVLTPDDVDNAVIDLAFPADGISDAQLKAYQQIASYGFNQGVTVNLIPVYAN